MSRPAFHPTCQPHAGGLLHDATDRLDDKAVAEEVATRLAAAALPSGGFNLEAALDTRAAYVAADRFLHAFFADCAIRHHRFDCATDCVDEEDAQPAAPAIAGSLPDGAAPPHARPVP